MGKRQSHEDWKAMYDGNDGFESTAPVGSFPDGASPFGVLDMAGNVWEWTADGYGDYGAGAATNPIGAAGARDDSHRVICGGGWGDNDAGAVRTALRQGVDPGSRGSTLGFRCARGD
jgi:formylglycine-generating enzyme required for sulfatase activity